MTVDRIYGTFCDIDILLLLLLGVL